MKIGILTYHRAHNYGALLQAYALKTFLGTKNDHVEFVDYWPDYHNESYKLLPNFGKLTLVQKIRMLLKVAFGYRKIQKRRLSYIHFMQKHLCLDKKVKFRSSSSFSDTEFDVLIYGSDQIWCQQNHTAFSGIDDVYFGEHIPSRKKYTYAASMGSVAISESEIFKIKKLLSNFDDIAVRESQLQALLRDQMQISSHLVLDPVFLLEKSRWNHLFPSKKIVKSPYIFFYNLIQTEEARAFVDRLSETTGFAVIEIQGKFNMMKLGARYKQQMAGPEEFLSLINDADIVVSTSFHGVAFSLILEKQFYAIGMEKNLERVSSLLQSIDLSDRYIHQSDEIIIPKGTIDYNNVGEKISKIKEMSTAYLNTIV